MHVVNNFRYNLYINLNHQAIIVYIDGSCVYSMSKKACIYNDS